MMHPATWHAAFALTAVIEIPVVFAATDARRAVWRGLASAFVAQLVTHPVVWFIFPRIADLSRREAVSLSELWAWLIEAGLYALFLPGVTPLRAVAVSGLANGASLGLGVVLSALTVSR